MKKYAIIVAGGKGLRMGSSTPKQFLKIDGSPVIVKTIERFIEYDPSILIIVVVPKDQVEAWNTISLEFLSQINTLTSIGGSTRFESVLAGLNEINGDGLVAIHDAVRPFVSIDTIQESYRSAEKLGSGVAAVEPKDSIRELVQDTTHTRNRSAFRMVQTPQTFRVTEIKDAYQRVGNINFSDDASVYEAAGYNVNLVSGTYSNIKITTPDDLQ